MTSTINSPLASGPTSRLRVAALLAAATPITAAVFAFAAPVAAALPVAAAPTTQAGDRLGIDPDPCHVAIQFAGLNTMKWPLCAAD